MTGLYNRRHFLSLAEAEWSRFQRYQRPLSMLMIDIDHFKSVNDRYGHAVGDEAIVSVATACLHNKRNPDVVGRLGGEEFAVLLPETDSAQAEIVAERIRERVAGHFLSVHSVQFKLTISIGFATAAVSMSGIDALMRAADTALYQAKQGGRNRVARWPLPEAGTPQAQFASGGRTSTAADFHIRLILNGESDVSTRRNPCLRLKRATRRQSVVFVSHSSTAEPQPSPRTGRR
jgi:diguanylate cyclase (GGDEF)-like protein